MEIPTQITFLNLDPSPAVEAQIRTRVDRLEKTFGRIIACRVTIKAGGARHRKGKLYHLRIDLSVPGREILVNRNPSEHHAHDDIRVAVGDAFDAVRRQLIGHAESVRGDVKAHGSNVQSNLTEQGAEEE